MLEEAISAWRNQLMDVGGRNYLLFYRDLRRGTLGIDERDNADQGIVSDLCKGNVVRLSHMFSEPEVREAAMKSARVIRNRAKEMLEERGLQTLLMFSGLATWADTGAGSAPNAPVFLMELKMEPRGRAEQDFDCTPSGEWRINSTMIHVLAERFDSHVQADSMLDIEVSLEANDLEAAAGLLSQAFSGVEGFAISERKVIGNFAQTTEMIDDISLNLDQLAESTIIMAIAGDADAKQQLLDRFPSVDISEPDTLPPENEFIVCDADASQSYVINAIERGADLVVQGPPGTGKSQTIANVIATFAAQGKNVLFVAEKEAAINAVVRRLRHVGLEDLVINIHGGVSSRRAFRQLIDRAIGSALQDRAMGIDDVEQRLAMRRDEVVQHNASMERDYEPWGVSPFRVLENLPGIEDEQEATDLRVSGANLQTWLQPELARDKEFIADFFNRRGGEVLSGKSPWSPAFSSDAVASVDQVRSLETLVDRLSTSGLPYARRATADVSQSLGVRPPASIQELDELSEMLRDLSEVSQHVLPAVFDQDLRQLADDFLPANTGSLRRMAASATNSAYQHAVKILEPLWSGQGSWRERYEVVALARAVQGTWFKFGGSGRLVSFSGWESHEGEVKLTSAALSELMTSSGLEGLDRKPLGQLEEMLSRLRADFDVLESIPRLRELVQHFSGRGLLPVLSQAADDGLDAGQATRRLHYVWFTSVLDEMERQDQRIAAFNSNAQRELVANFSKADRDHIVTTPTRVWNRSAASAKEVMEALPTELQTVQSQIRRRSGGLSPRDLLAEAPNLLTRIRPCWAMSPSDVARYMPPGQHFDLVIFDEASQIVPAAAIGAISRGRRAVVAGDSHQLPPTSFFSSSSSDGAGGAPASLVSGFESILEVMSGLLPPPTGTRVLSWHYRSQDERLIAFSNAQPSLYRRAMVTFPGISVGGAINFVHAPNGDSSDGESSDAEVIAVLALIKQHARERPEDSLGVIAFGSTHADRIREVVRRERQSDSVLERFCSKSDIEEEFFIKNLERVQGDERDSIILTSGYGKNADGRMMYRFGPINEAGGERRLNVAITRAKKTMTLVSNFTSADMDPSRLNSEGAQMLRRYYEYAESGGTKLGAMATRTEPLNPFELDVLDKLKKRGMNLHPQWGAAGYWIDFAVSDPELPGKMILAIECDGRTYHSSKTARDRDRKRQDHLERLGWRFHRIWSHSWFRHRDDEVERAVRALEEALQISNETAESQFVSLGRITEHADIDDEQVPLEPTVPPTATDNLPGMAPLAGVSTSEVREWARVNGLAVGQRGRLHPDLIAKWNRAHPERPLNG
jgi:very-short-patch-repair endonuclease